MYSLLMDVMTSYVITTGIGTIAQAFCIKSKSVLCGTPRETVIRNFVCRNAELDQDVEGSTAVIDLPNDSGSAPIHYLSTKMAVDYGNLNAESFTNYTTPSLSASLFSTCKQLSDRNECCKNFVSHIQLAR